MKPRDIDLDTFKNMVDQFYSWANKTPRRPSSWFLSLEQWATARFNETFDQEQSLDRNTENDG
jgi:hypothetical protein